MGEVIQLQGDQRKDVQEFLVDKKEGLELDAKTIKVLFPTRSITSLVKLTHRAGSWVLDPTSNASIGTLQWTDRSSFSKPKSLTPCLLCWFDVSNESLRWGVGRYPLSASVVEPGEAFFVCRSDVLVTGAAMRWAARPFILYYGSRA